MMTGVKVVSRAKMMMGTAEVTTATRTETVPVRFQINTRHSSPSNADLPLEF